MGPLPGWWKGWIDKGCYPYTNLLHPKEQKKEFALKGCQLLGFSYFSTSKSSLDPDWVQSLRPRTYIASLYKGCSESNASYFIMSAHGVRGGCRQYGSRGWTFPPVFHYGAMWEMAAEGKPDKTASGIETQMKQSHVTEFLHMEKRHPLTFSDTCSMLLENKQWMWAQWGIGGAFQQWWQQQCFTSASADFYEYSTQALAHQWW